MPSPHPTGHGVIRMPRGTTSSSLMHAQVIKLLGTGRPFYQHYEGVTVSEGGRAHTRGTHTSRAVPWPAMPCRAEAEGAAAGYFQ